MKKITKIIIAISLIIIIGLGFFLLAGQQRPMPEALEAMKSDDKVEVIEEDYIVFKPKNTEVNKAMILYPEVKVDPRAYAPTAKAIAEQGIAVFIVKIPFNLAIFGYDKADKVILENDYMDEWYIAGHSLGGVMAARYAKKNQDSLDGFILWAAYPDENTDLSKTEMPVLSIYGSNDNIALPGDITDAQYLLPDSVQWVSIKGANHSQFGWYGLQKGDNKADITREEQQKEIVETTIEFIKQLKIFFSK